MRLPYFRHKKWVPDATITETVLENGMRRFTATILGFQNWKIGEFAPGPDVAKTVIAKVKEIHARISSEDESVFGT
jgi:hypothetical protein